MSYYVSHEEEAKQGTIKCAILASVVVFGMLSILIYGLAWFQSTDKINADIYGAKNLEKRIEILEKRIEILETIFLNHTHRYYDGHIKEPIMAK